MKKYLSMLLVFCLLLTLAANLPGIVSAEISGYYTYTVSNGKATITKCSTSIRGDITIPSELGGYPVTSIWGYAFYNCFEIKSVVIPDSVTSIDVYAFGNCNRLADVEIGSGVKNIEYYAFWGCTGLTSISIPDNVTTIRSNSFDSCAGLTAITVSDGNENYSSLDGVLFNKDKTELIYYPSGKTGEYIIPDSVTSIESGVFNGCTGLTGITVSDSNENYSSLDGVLFNKDKTELIYYPLGKMGEYIMPVGVTRIRGRAFNGCTGFTSIAIPDSVTVIDGYAFGNCTGLTSVVIPNSVTSIGEGVFYGCTGLNKIYFIGTRAEWEALETYVPSSAEVIFVDVSGIKVTTLPTKLLYDRGDELDASGGKLTVYYNEETDSFDLDLCSVKITGFENTTQVIKTLTVSYAGKTCTFDVQIVGVLGDANADGVVNVLDAMAVLQYTVNGTGDSFSQMSADIDGDGVINVMDAMAILRMTVE